MKMNRKIFYPSLIVLFLIASVFGQSGTSSGSLGNAPISNQKAPILHIGKTAISMTSFTGNNVQITLISIDGVTRIRDYVDINYGMVDVYMNTSGIVPGSYVCLVNIGDVTLKKRVVIAR